MKSKNSNLKEGNPFNTYSIGPEDDKLDMLNLEERKQRRSETPVIMKTSIQEPTLKESILSTADCTESRPNFLAKLARQAIQSK